MTTCPTDVRLRSLLNGQVGETEQAELQQHIDSCERCQQALEGLVAGKESWDGIARRLGDGDTPVTPALHEAINAAKELEATIPSVQLPPGLLQSAEQADSMGRLAHYEILQEVGSGGMGIVLKAFDTSLRRVVAIKVMAPHLAANAAARRRFVREAQAAAAVAHEHVVAIHAVADQHEPPYLAMQFIEGKTLQERLDKVGPLSVREVLRIGMQTAAGLAAAHAQGLVHRDIKPANILLENGVERVKLTDFGLARAVDDASVTQSGVIAGTPLFMSPEQARGEVVDHRSDLFSLGSVMYAMCVGHAPFRASTTMGVIKRVCDDPPRPICEVNPDVPDWLSEIIAKLLAKSPTDRFQTAKEVADLLERCLAHMQKPSDVSRPVAIRASEGSSPTATADTDDEPASEAQSSSVGAFVIAFFVGFVPLFAAGQVSVYPELAPPGISPRAFAALLRVVAVACWCLIPTIHWWRESRKPKPRDAGPSSGGVPQSAAPTQLAAASPRQVPFLFSPWSALWLAVFLLLPIAGLNLSGAFSAHDTLTTLAIAIFVWLTVVDVGAFFNGIRRRAAAAGIPLADLAPGWRIRCTKCNRSKPLGEVGGIRLGARSRGKWTLAWCSQCHGLRWAAIERVPATSETQPMVADPSSREKPAVKRGWWKFALIAAVIVVCAWRFGPSIMLMVRNQGRIVAELKEKGAKLVLHRNGLTAGSVSNVEAFDGATLDLLPGSYDVEIVPRAGRMLDRVSYLHKTMFHGAYESNNPGRWTMYVRRGDLTLVSATFREGSSPDLTGGPSSHAGQPGTLTLPTLNGKPWDWKAATLANVTQFDLNGDWSSSWSTVTVTHELPKDGAETLPVKATYYDGKGTIEGTLNIATRTFVGRFRESRNGDRNGPIRLVIAEDGMTIKGVYAYRQRGMDADPTELTYQWDMTRRSPPELASREASTSTTTEQMELVQTLPVLFLVNQVFVSPESQDVVVVGAGLKTGVVKTLDSATLAVTHVNEFTETLRAFAVLPVANRFLMAESDSNGFRLRDDKTFELVTSFANHSVMVTSLAASRDGRWFASGDLGGSVVLWQYDHQKTAATTKGLSGHAQQVTTLAFSPDGSLLASGSLDKTVRVFDVATGQLKYLYDRTTDQIAQVAFSPDGQSLAAVSDKMVWIYDPKTGDWIGSLRGHGDKLTSVAWSPDGKLVAAGSVDGTTLVFNRSSGHIVARADAHQNQVFGVAFLNEQPQGQRLATAYRGFVHIWRLRP